MLVQMNKYEIWVLKKHNSISVALFPCKQADKQETSVSLRMLIPLLVRTRHKFYTTFNMGKHYKAAD